MLKIKEAKEEEARQLVLKESKRIDDYIFDQLADMMSEECAGDRLHGYSLSAVPEESVDVVSNVNAESNVPSKHDDENVDICDDLKKIASHENIIIDLSGGVGGGVGDGQSTQAGSSPSVIKSPLEKKKKNLLALKLEHAIIEKVKLNFSDPEVAKDFEKKTLEKLAEKSKVA